MNLCGVDDCNTAQVAKGMCGKHYARFKRYGDVHKVHKPGLKRGEHRQETVGYAGAHARVRAKRGRASEHLCECGSQAQDWSYTHTDPDDIETLWADHKGVSKLVRYSMNVEAYEPLCKACHVSKDKTRMSSV